MPRVQSESWAGNIARAPRSGALRLHQCPKQWHYADVGVKLRLEEAYVNRVFGQWKENISACLFSADFSHWKVND
jgi:hypothetical protein